MADRWAIIAEERGERPFNSDSPCSCATKKAQGDYDPNCPFCPGAERRTTPAIEIVALKENALSVPSERRAPDDFEFIADPTPDTRERRKWFLRVVGNMYPILSMGDSNASLRADLSGAFAQFLAEPNAFYRTETAFGRHEVVIDSDRHCRGWSEMTSLEIKLAFRVFRSRLRVMRDIGEFAYAFVFKNVGESAGASQPHTHCQLTANVSLPPELNAELRRLDEFTRASGGRSYWRELVANELRDGRRVVFDTERFLAYCPYASRSPMQIEICPRFDGAFEDYADAELDELAELAREVVALLQRAKTVYLPTDSRPLDYNVFQRNAPYRASAPFADALKAFRPRWVITPTLVKKAGFELGCGLDVNPISPETAAARLRDVL